MIHLHINRIFVHNMWCGVNILATPPDHKWTFDRTKVDCPGCLERMEKAEPRELIYADDALEFQRRKEGP